MPKANVIPYHPQSASVTKKEYRIKRIREASEAGFPMRDLSEELGISITRVYQIAAQAGIRFDFRNIQRKLNVEKITELAALGLTCKEISRKLHLSIGCVWNIADVEGIKLQPHNKSKKQCKNQNQDVQSP